ncbi:MAG: dipeptidase, partial [Clostridia bacterium]|nr:dipeptidase [Clostridia bacterium]
TGTRAEAMAVGGGTYAHGISGAVAYGPELQGIDNRIHGAEEFITVEHFKLNTKMMYKAVTELDKRLN